MKPIKGLAALLALCLIGPCSALADTEQLSGTVEAGYEIAVTAPFGGTITGLHVRAGQWVNEGDPLLTVEPTRYFSPIDGTVTGVDAKPGDNLDADPTAGGKVLSLAPVSKYTVSCSVEDVYGTDDPARKYVNRGEKVYIRCVKDRSHVALGKVNAVSGLTFTVETTGGELYLEEEVNIYRDSGYSFSSWIGAGTVARAEAVEMTGTGSLLRLLVAEGDEVERGQLLYETVTGSLDGYAVSGCDILSTASGVAGDISLSIGGKLAKGARVIGVSPRESFQLAVTVPEDMITRIHEGDKLRFFLDWDEGEPRWYEGTVAALSYVSTTTTGDTTTFTAYLDFDADESVRLGMNGVVELEQAEDALAEPEEPTEPTEPVEPAEKKGAGQ